MVVRSKFTKIALGVILAGGTLGLSGCGDLVNGANLKVTIEYKPSKPEGEATAAATTPGATTEATAAEGVGTLRGKVEYSGSISQTPMFTKGADIKDAAVCSAVDVPDETVQGRDGGLANVFIYLKKAPKNVPTAPDTPLIFDQKHCTFKPHAMSMRTGQIVKVLNSDGVAHNTHTYGVKTTSFNSIVPPNDAVGANLIYKQAELEPISVGCDIHPWMKAFHLPIDHPFIALSSEDGTFEIKDLPAGKHEFKVWHEAGKLLEKALVVTVKPGDNDPLTIKVSPSQLGR